MEKPAYDDDGDEVVGQEAPTPDEDTAETDGKGDGSNPCDQSCQHGKATQRELIAIGKGTDHKHGKDRHALEEQCSSQCSGEPPSLGIGIFISSTSNVANESAALGATLRWLVKPLSVAVRMILRCSSMNPGSL